MSTSNGKTELIEVTGGPDNPFFRAFREKLQAVNLPGEVEIRAFRLICERENFGKLYLSVVNGKKNTFGFVSGDLDELCTVAEALQRSGVAFRKVVNTNPQPFASRSGEVTLTRASKWPFAADFTRIAVTGVRGRLTMVISVTEVVGCEARDTQEFLLVSEAQEALSGNERALGTLDQLLDDLRKEIGGNGFPRTVKVVDRRNRH